MRDDLLLIPELSLPFEEEQEVCATGALEEVFGLTPELVILAERLLGDV